MKAQDVWHHDAQVSYTTNLKNHSDACWDFQPNHYKSTCGVAKDYTPTRLWKQMGESQLSNTTMLS